MGKEALKVFNDANQMIDELIANGSLTANGIVGFYRANSVNDEDIVLMDEDGNEIATLYGLRQQAVKDSHDNAPYASLADLVAPKETGLTDYVGLFAVSAGFGAQVLSDEFNAKNDPYGDIMIKAVADRLAEAFAEELHQRVRRELWGYQPTEQLDAADLLKVKYEGIRPAPGYPSQPDHTEKETIWKVMDVEAKTGIQLTDSLAIWPAASTCGVYFAHPKSAYFAVGKIQKDQVVSYAERKKMSLEETEKWLSPMLAYEP